MKFLNRNKFFNPVRNLVRKIRTSRRFQRLISNGVNRYLPMALSVIVLVTTFSIYFISQKNKVADAAWYSASWTYRKPITIDHNKISQTATTTFSSFPLLVSVTDSDLKFTSFSGGKVASTTGADILFTSSDGTTKLDHEIETYASSTGQLIAWVRIPTMHATYDDIIYIYFGNSGAADQSNKTGVWDSFYKGVYHVPNGTTLTVADSTSNANNGTIYANPSATAGQIGGAANFASGSDRVGITSVSLSGVNYTISAWMNTPLPGACSGYCTLVRGANDHPVLVNPSNLLGEFDNAGGTGFHSSGFDVTTLAGGWHYLSAIVSGSNTAFYIDGASVGSSNIKSNDDIQYFGNYQGGGQAWGKTDEVRISTGISRSVDWIVTEYKNQVSPSTFYSYGALGINTTGVTANSGAAGAAWYSSSWSYRKPITIDHNKISTTATSTFSSFPLLFSVTDSDLKFTGSGGKVASSTGGDLLFTASDGITKLDFELEKYASTTGQTIAWVRIPTMHATYDDTIFIYFGNASATDQSNKTGVWDGNYKQVYHFPNGTTLSMADSTSNTNNLTNNNFTATSTKIDGGISGNGSTSYGNPNSVVSASNYTVSAWFNTSANFAGSYGFIYETSPRNYAIYMDSSSGFGANYFKVSMQDSGLGYHDVHSNVTLNDGNWHYAVGTYDGTNEYLYIDGVKQTDTTTSASAATPTTGTFGANSPSAYTYNGLLDETRISNTPRSADWIKTEYNNQLSPSTFYSYGALGANTTTGSKVANRGAGISWYSSSWSYRKPITIDHNKISQTATTTFSSFPLLFSVTDSDLKFTGSGGKVASSTGGDLLFTASDGITKLDFELEKYASTTGQTIAWVRIPTMHATYDDTIYIYFGNSGAADQSNKTGVWDSTYGGVWHLPDGTTLTTNDSTGNANNGTNHGAAASAGQVGGGANIGTLHTNDIALGSNSSITAASRTQMSVEGWFKFNTTADNQMLYVDATSGDFWRFIFGLYSSDCNTSRIAFSTRDTSTGDAGTREFICATAPAAGVWYHYFAVYDSGASSKVFYINGASDVSTGSSVGSFTATASSAVSVGDVTDHNYTMGGYADEVRVSNIARSADWVKTDYNNQISPSTFYSYGALGAGSRQDSSGASAPTIKVRGGVKFH